MPEHGWQAVLPFKANGQSKQRLSLGPEVREALARQWLLKAIECCRACQPIEKIHVLTLGPRPELPVDIEWFQQPNRGLNEGLQSWHGQVRPCRALVLLPDLPGLQSQELDHFLAPDCPSHLRLAPDRHGRGCNALALNHPEALFCFGPESLSRFQERAGRQGLSWECRPLPGLAHDVDTLEDWNELSCPVL